MIFRDKEYEVNIYNGRTVFAPVGVFDLGDRVVFEVIERKYLVDNPDEDVVFCSQVFDPVEVKQRLNPDKFFWSDVSMFVPPPKEAILYKLYEEAEALKEIGFYPRYDLFVEAIHTSSLKRQLMSGRQGGGNTTMDRAGEFLHRDYVVLHLRNVKKRAEKNVPAELAKSVFNYLIGLKKNIVLLGNDEPYANMIVNFSNVLDLRGKLDIKEIAYILNRAKMFIGSDSGIAHLAGACSECPLIVWGLWERAYMPKVVPGRIKYLMREESTFQGIMGLIDE